MPYILNALWNTFELWNTHELIIMINASTGIKKKEKKGKRKDWFVLTQYQRQNTKQP